MLDLHLCPLWIRVALERRTFQRKIKSFCGFVIRESFKKLVQSSSAGIAYDVHGFLFGKFNELKVLVVAKISNDGEHIVHDLDFDEHVDSVDDPELANPDAIEVFTADFFLTLDCPLLALKINHIKLVVSQSFYCIFCGRAS